MSIAAPRRPAYACERTESGGWRITLPLECCPSSNETLREHPMARGRRVNDVSGNLFWLRRSRNLPEPVFERARLTMTLYFARRNRRDPQNYAAGAGGKALVDGLCMMHNGKPRSGWIRDDDESRLLTTTPLLWVDKAWPRVVIELEPWNGVR